jgi:hypothetical protein
VTNKPLWYVAIFGLIGLGAMVMFMTVSLEGLKSSPAGNRVKLAESVRQQFGFDRSAAAVDAGPQRSVLVVSYHPKPGPAADPSAQTRELQAVAEFAGKTYDGDDRKRIDEIEVRRVEVRGRGCWKNEYVNKTSIRNPQKQATFNPFPLRPQPVQPPQK